MPIAETSSSLRDGDIIYGMWDTRYKMTSGPQAIPIKLYTILQCILWFSVGYFAAATSLRLWNKQAMLLCLDMIEELVFRTEGAITGSTCILVILLALAVVEWN